MTAAELCRSCGTVITRALDGAWEDARGACGCGDGEHEPAAPAAADIVTCGTCLLSWDDAIATSWTPAPAARCPFEYFHEYAGDGDPIELDPETDIPPSFEVRPVVRP